VQAGAVDAVVPLLSIADKAEPIVFQKYANMHGVAAACGTAAESVNVLVILETRAAGPPAAHCCSYQAHVQQLHQMRSVLQSTQHRARLAIYH